MRRVRVWQLVVLLVLSVAASAYFLRQNNLGMVELRNAVKQADEQGGDTRTALLNLQKYVLSHMNTSLGNGVFLQNTYQRAYDKAVETAVNYTNPNSQIYTQVEAECRPAYQRGGFYAYVQCAHQKLETLAPGQDPLASLKPPPIELYTYNFAPPLWSLDAAGLSLLAALFLSLLLILRLVGYVTLRLLLKSRHQ